MLLGENGGGPLIKVRQRQLLSVDRIKKRCFDLGKKGGKGIVSWVAECRKPPKKSVEREKEKKL